MCNARPCYNCLNMMKCVGINRVYYSISPNEIICEYVKYMVSIQASSITRQLDLKIRNYNNLTSYYENLLIKNFPSHIRQFNLEQFIKFNLNVFLADYTVIICSKNGKEYVIISNFDKIKLLEVELI